jgi:phage recombination protein Bet
VSNAIAKTDTTCIREDQIAVIKDTIAKGATDAELTVFVQTCNRLSLDPFARQIFLVKRWDTELGRHVATPQVSIDGFRLVADRTRQYRGQTAPQWCGKDGKWTDVWLQDQPPAAARVGVYREGFAEPLVRVARYASYVQTKKGGDPNSMWTKMADVMLAKCAESLALRAAFPNELSGVYTVDEYPEAEATQQTQPAHQPLQLAADTKHDADGVVVTQQQTQPTVAVKAAYTFEKHLSMLERIGKEKLQGWVLKLFEMNCTVEQNEQAWVAFSAKCLAEGVSPDDYVPQQKESA